MHADSLAPFRAPVERDSDGQHDRYHPPPAAKMVPQEIRATAWIWAQALVSTIGH